MLCMVEISGEEIGDPQAKFGMNPCGCERNWKQTKKKMGSSCCKDMQRYLFGFHAGFIWFPSILTYFNGLFRSPNKRRAFDLFLPLQRAVRCENLARTASSARCSSGGIRWFWCCATPSELCENFDFEGTISAPLSSGHESYEDMTPDNGKRGFSTAMV